MLRNVQHRICVHVKYLTVSWGAIFAIFVIVQIVSVFFPFTILSIWGKKSIEIKTFAGLYPNDCFAVHNIFRTFFFFRQHFQPIRLLSSFVHSQNPTYMTGRPLYLAIVKSRSAQTMRYKKKKTDYSELSQNGRINCTNALIDFVIGAVV